MIHYQLCCSADHAFDGWFRDAAAFDMQANARLVACPECADTAVRRALMAPSIKRGRKTVDMAGREASAPAAAPPPAAPAPVAVPDRAAVAMPDQVRAMLQKLRSEVEAKCENVGPRFAEEARAIHHGETEARGIYGETTAEQAEALADEGIEVARIPWVPRSDG